MKQYEIREWWRRGSATQWNHIGPFWTAADAIECARWRFDGYVYGGEPDSIDILCNGEVIAEVDREKQLKVVPHE